MSFIGFLFSLVGWLFALLILFLVVFTPLAFIFDRLERRNNRLLQSAPSEFSEAGHELNNHFRDCRAILIAEVRNKHALNGSSPFGLARAKTMRLLQQARPAIRRLYRSDPTERRYREEVKIERIYDCCSQCKSRNEHGDGPVCGVFDADGEVFVDLGFQEA